MNPIKITVEYDNGRKEVLEDDVEEWMLLLDILEKIATQRGVNIKDFNWKEE